MIHAVPLAHLHVVLDHAHHNHVVRHLVVHHLVHHVQPLAHLTPATNSR